MYKDIITEIRKDIDELEKKSAFERTFKSPMYYNVDEYLNCEIDLDYEYENMLKPEIEKLKTKFNKLKEEYIIFMAGEFLSLGLDIGMNLVKPNTLVGSEDIKTYGIDNISFIDPLRTVIKTVSEEFDVYQRRIVPFWKREIQFVHGKKAINIDYSRINGAKFSDFKRVVSEKIKAYHADSVDNIKFINSLSDKLRLFDYDINLQCNKNSVLNKRRTISDAESSLDKMTHMVNLHLALKMMLEDTELYENNIKIFKNDLKFSE